MTERSDISRDNDGFEIPDVHSSSAEYAQRFSGAIGGWLLSVQKSITRALLPEEFTRCLDAGGGHGQNLDLWLDQPAEVVILGSQLSCADLIKSRLFDDRLRFSIGPLTQIPFANEYFDLAVSFRMLTHLMDWQAHIAELCRVSSKTVLVEYPVKRGFNTWSSSLFGWKKRIEKNTRPYTLFDQTQIVSEFEKHGFRLVACRSQFFWPMALHRLHKIVALGRFAEECAKLLGFTRLWGSPMISRFDREGV